MYETESLGTFVVCKYKFTIVSVQWIYPLLSSIVNTVRLMYNVWKSDRDILLIITGVFLGHFVKMFISLSLLH